MLPTTKQSTALRTYLRRKAKKSKQKQETCTCTRPSLQLERPGVHLPLCHFCFSLQVIALTAIDAKHCSVYIIARMGELADGAAQRREESLATFAWPNALRVDALCCCCSPPPE